MNFITDNKIDVNECHNKNIFFVCWIIKIQSLHLLLLSNHIDAIDKLRNIIITERQDHLSSRMKNIVSSLVYPNSFLLNLALELPPSLAMPIYWKGSIFTTSKELTIKASWRYKQQQKKVGLLGKVGHFCRDVLVLY